MSLLILWLTRIVLANGFTCCLFVIATSEITYANLIDFQGCFSDYKCVFPFKNITIVAYKDGKSTLKADYKHITGALQAHILQA